MFENLSGLIPVVLAVLVIAGLVIWGSLRAPVTSEEIRK